MRKNNQQQYYAINFVPDLMQHLPHKIHQLRSHLKLTVNELASLLGINPKIVMQWESGITVPTLFALWQLAQIGKVNLEYFIDRKVTLDMTTTNQMQGNLTYMGKKVSSTELTYLRHALNQYRIKHKSNKQMKSLQEYQAQLKKDANLKMQSKHRKPTVWSFYSLTLNEKLVGLQKYRQRVAKIYQKISNYQQTLTQAVTYNQTLPLIKKIENELNKLSALNTEHGEPAVDFNIYQQLNCLSKQLKKQNQPKIKAVNQLLKKLRAISQSLMVLQTQLLQTSDIETKQQLIHKITKLMQRFMQLSVQDENNPAKRSASVSNSKAPVAKTKAPAKKATKS